MHWPPPQFWLQSAVGSQVRVHWPSAQFWVRSAAPSAVSEQVPSAQLEVQSALFSQVVWQFPPAQLVVQSELGSQTNVQAPEGQSKVQLASVGQVQAVPATQSSRTMLPASWVVPASWAVPASGVLPASWAVCPASWPVWFEPASVEVVSPPQLQIVATMQPMSIDENLRFMLPIQRQPGAIRKIVTARAEGARDCLRSPISCRYRRVTRCVAGPSL